MTSYHPCGSVIFGYLATAGLIGAVLFSIIERTRKNAEQYRHSHESDWIFLVLLLFVAVSGILQHVLHRVGLETAAKA